MPIFLNIKKQMMYSVFIPSSSYAFFFIASQIYVSFYVTDPFFHLDKFQIVRQEISAAVHAEAYALSLIHIFFLYCRFPTAPFPARFFPHHYQVRIAESASDKAHAVFPSIDKSPSAMSNAIRHQQA